MFFDEMEAFDRVKAVDSGFAKQANSSNGRGKRSFTLAAQEMALKNPALNQKNNAAAVNENDGVPWWQHGPAWERRRKKP